jgi:hypothetical protein
VQKLAGAAAALIALSVATSSQANQGDPLRLSIVTPPPGASASDGSSDHAAFSKDNRDVRMVAFDSVGTDLVPGDTNRRRDVFVLVKQRGAGRMGGRIARVSVGRDGAQSNGDSAYPSVDGTTGSVPHCIAFQSTATNLAAGASSHVSSVYVRDLSRRTTRLVSPGSQSAADPSIDGRCRAVAYEGDGWVLLRDLGSGRLLRIARGEYPDLQTDAGGVAYESGGQVYLQRLTRTRRGTPVRLGPRVLVSRTRGGRPGNGVSTNPAVDDHGNHVAFQSNAGDLCLSICPGHVLPGPADSGQADEDVFIAVLRPAKGSTTPRMNFLGAGENPRISRAGEDGVFQSDRLGYVGPRVTNVYRWHWSARYNTYVRQLLTAEPSWRVGTFAFNGPSVNPSLSSRGNYVAFTSFGSGLFGESNGPTISDVFMRFIGVSHEGLPTY